MFSFTLAILFLTLPGCQSVDEPESASSSGSASAPQSARPSKATADEGYPDLHSVPPRPQLSYTIQQERAIVDALIADREHARYTNRVIRYRTGVSSLPPPPEPPKRAAAAPAPAETAKPSTPTVAEQPADTPEVAPYPSLGMPGDQNNTLGDFLNEMERSTQPTPQPAPNEPPPVSLRPAPSGAVPANPATSAGLAAAHAQTRATEQDVGSNDGPVKRMLAWVSDLFDPAEPDPAADAPAAQIPAVQATAADASHESRSASAPRALFALRTPSGGNRGAAEPLEQHPAALVAGVGLAGPAEPGPRAPAAAIEPPEAPGSTPAPIPVAAPRSQRAQVAGAAVPRPALRPAPAPAPAPPRPTSGIVVADGTVALPTPAPPDRDATSAEIAFAPGSAVLSSDARARLGRFLAMARARQAPIRIVGEGAPPALALDRARAVGVALVGLGAAANRLTMTAALEGEGDLAHLSLAGPRAR